MSWLDHVKQEGPAILSVARTAPIALLIIFGLCFSASWWFLSERIETVRAQNERYRLALGIGDPSHGILVALSHGELKIKAMRIIAELRDLHLGWQKRAADVRVRFQNKQLTEAQHKTQQEALRQEYGEISLSGYALMLFR